LKSNTAKFKTPYRGLGGRSRRQGRRQGAKGWGQKAGGWSRDQAS